MESWRSIDWINGYENLYAISNFGRVKSFQRTLNIHGGWTREKKESILKAWLDSSGYPTVIFRNNGYSKSLLVHHLVWDAFSERKRHKRYRQIDHVDNNPLNNNFANLQLLSIRENVAKGKLLKSKTSKFTGVSWDKKNSKWRSMIHIDGHNITIGYFTIEKDAAESYQEQLLKVINQKH